MVIIPMALSLTVHEFAHAFAAKKLGDDTAEKMGRLNLNPLSHADPFGTVLVPLIILVANRSAAGGIPLFGWAKPVPVNAGRFTRRITARRGSMIVSGAGPLANLAMALLSGGILSVVQHQGLPVAAALQQLLLQMIFINVALGVFNLLPIYPLDGEKMVAGFLGAEQAIRFERFNQQFGTWILWGIIFFARDLISIPVQFIAQVVLAAVRLT